MFLRSQESGGKYLVYTEYNDLEHQTTAEIFLNSESRYRINS